MQRQALLLLLLILPFAAEVRAEEKPAHLRAADAAVTAFEAEDAAAMKALAERSRPDPWEVADALWARGRLDVAQAFAKAAPRFETEGLVTWLGEAASRGSDKPAREAFEAAVGLFRANRIPDAIKAFLAIQADWPTVTTMLALGEVPFLQARLGKFEAALATARRGTKKARAIGWHDFEISMLQMEARLLAELDRPADARDVLRAVVSTARRLRDPTIAGGLLVKLSRANLALGHEDKALVQVQEAVTRLEPTQGPALLGALVVLGIVWSELEEHPRALATYESAYALAKAIGHVPHQANILSNISIERSDIGDPGGALIALRQALQLGTENRRPENVASSYHQLAHLQWRMGRPADALDAIEKSLEYARRSGLAIPMAAAELSKTGFLADLGQGAEQRDRIEDALDLAAKRHLNPTFHAQLHESLADLLEAEGDLDGAREQYRHAIKLLTGGNRDARRLSTRENLALLEKRSGRATDAVAELRLIIAARIKGGRPAANATTRLNLAHLLMDQDRAGARRQLDQALATAKASGDTGLLHPIHVMRATWYAAEQDWPAALAEVKQARAFARSATRGLSELHGTVARERRRSVFELGLGIALEMKDHDEALAFLESGRADGLLQGLSGREAVQAATLPQDLVRAASLARASETAAQHALRRAREGSSRKARREALRALEAARRENEALAARVDRAARRTRDIIDVEPATLSELKASLSAHEALVLYATTQRRFVALRVTPKGTEALDLGPRTEIEALALALDCSDAETDVTATIAALRKRVVEPLKLNASTTRVHVSPAAALAYVPLALLMPKRSVVHVPSGTTRLLLLRGESTIRGHHVLGLGDPIYDQEASSLVHTRGGPLSSLPGTRIEVKAVADLQLLGAAATEQGLREALATRPHWRSVHFACHGLVDAEHPMRSSLAITPDANDDGYLTALDVMRMRIPADLTVLSACETGRGKVFHSEGVVGLTRAFMFAGAPRVICSLWKVDDEATRALMTELYKRWNPKQGKGLPLAEALRAAQAEIRAKPGWSHPYYWAAWQLWGLGE